MSSSDPSRSEPPRSSRRRKRSDSKSFSAESLSGATIGPSSQSSSPSSGDDFGASHASETGAFAVSKDDANLRYERIGELGRGGWGVVDRVVDRQLEREVAVKRILSKDSDANDPATIEATKRFLREAKITSQLQHPGIVPVHELGIGQSNETYYVMKLLDGDTFRSQIRRCHASDSNASDSRQSRKRTAAELQDRIAPLLDRFVDVCNAVAYAHGNGIIHRDLKPTNIMVGSFGETIVLDWGLAHRFHSTTENDVTSADWEADGTIVGTPAYMSPEQSLGKVDQMDHRSDIYSLGVMLYEIILGKHPHAGRSVNEVLRRVQVSNYLPIRSAQPACPTALAAIVETAMAVAPENRYESAEVLADDIRRFIAGDPVSVHQETMLDRAARWCRRHRSIAATIAASLVVLLLASAIFAVILHRAHQAEHAARVEAESAHRAAVERLVETREATDTWLIDLSGSLQYFPGMDPLRDELLQKAILQYERLIEVPLSFSRGVGSASDVSAGDVSAGDSNLPSPSESIAMMERAKCHLRLGDLYRLTDCREQSSEQYAVANQLLESLSYPVTKANSTSVRLISLGESSSQHPTFQERVRLEQVNGFIGSILAQPSRYDFNQVADHRTWLDRQLKSYIENSKVPPSDFVCKTASAAARLELAIARTKADLWSHPDSRQRAMSWSQWLIQVRGKPSDRSLFESVHTEIATWYEQNLEFELAAQTWSLLLAELEAFLPETSQHPEHLQTIAHVRLRLAGAAVHCGRHDAAVTRYRQAIRELESAWRMTDSDSFFRTNLATAETNLGQLIAEGTAAEQKEAYQLLSRSLRTYQSLLQEQASPDRLRRLAETHMAIAKLRNSSPNDQPTEHILSAILCYQVLFDHKQLDNSDRHAWSEAIESVQGVKLSSEQKTTFDDAIRCIQSFSELPSHEL